MSAPERNSETKSSSRGIGSLPSNRAGQHAIGLGLPFRRVPGETKGLEGCRLVVAVLGLGGLLLAHLLALTRLALDLLELRIRPGPGALGMLAQADLSRAARGGLAINAVRV